MAVIRRRGQYTALFPHKPLKCLFTSEIKNRKIQMWPITISAYNCRIKYMKGQKNEQADMLFRVSHAEEAGEVAQPDVSAINSNRIAAFEDSDRHVSDNLKEVLCVKEKTAPLPDMIEEQKSHPEVNTLRETVDNPETPQGVKKKYVLIDDLLYSLGSDDDEREPHTRHDDTAQVQRSCPKTVLWWMLSLGRWQNTWPNSSELSLGWSI